MRKRVRGAVKRMGHVDTFFVDVTVQNKFNDVMLALINSTALEYNPSIAYMVAPFVKVMPKESDIYYR